jgi:hypothetical protein
LAKKEAESQLLLDIVLMGIVGGIAALSFGWMLHACDKLFLNDGAEPAHRENHASKMC